MQAEDEIMKQEKSQVGIVVVENGGNVFQHKFKWKNGVGGCGSVTLLKHKGGDNEI